MASFYKNFYCLRLFFSIAIEMISKSLVIDASTITFQVGMLEGNQFTTFSSSSDDTLSGFFSILSPFINHPHWDEIIFCEGPGKLMGIRSTLLFTRIFKIIHPYIRIYSYSTLVFVDRIRHCLPLPPESLLCAPKNNEECYIFEHNQIFSTKHEALQQRKEAIHCIATHHRKSSNKWPNLIKYHLEDHGHVLRTIMTPNETVQTAYDPHNEYKKNGIQNVHKSPQNHTEARP
jgi:hypothetical protein